MSTMVEKVAIAIFCAREGDTQEMWDRSRGPWKDEYRQQARAAIGAMMEPTPEMLVAGEDEDTFMANGVLVERSDAAHHYAAMVQAALKEEGQ